MRHYFLVSSKLAAFPLLPIASTYPSLSLYLSLSRSTALFPSLSCPKSYLYVFLYIFIFAPGTETGHRLSCSLPPLLGPLSPHLASAIYGMRQFPLQSPVLQIFALLGRPWVRAFAAYPSWISDIILRLHPKWLRHFISSWVDLLPLLHLPFPLWITCVLTAYLMAIKSGRK